MRHYLHEKTKFNVYLDCNKYKYIYFFINIILFYILYVTMSEHNLCRICLRTNGKMYEYHKFQLKVYYEEIMALKILDDDDLTRQFCYECAGLLYKYHKFKEKCYRGLKVLKDIVFSGSIPYDRVLELDRKTHNLESQLNIITVNDCVRTCIIKHKTAASKSKSHKTDIPDIENVNFDVQNDISNKHDDMIYNSEYDPIEEVIIDEKKHLKIVETFTDEAQENDNNLERSLADKINIQLGDTVIDSKDLDNISEKDNEAFVSTDDEKTLIDFKKFDLTSNSNHETKIEKTVKKKSNKRKKRSSKEDSQLNKMRFKLGCKKNKFLESNNWSRTFLTEDEAEKAFKMKAGDNKYLKAPFKCSDCFKGFSQQDMLSRHKKLRHAESLGPLECRFCHMRFKWKCNLTKHMSRHYTIYKCLRCDLVCNLDTSAEFHENYHNGIIRKCKLCGKEFTHQSTYYSHLRTHRSQHICHQCGASFVSEVGLHMHRLIKHVDTPKPQDCEKADTDGDTFCERCDIRFETRQAYEEHLFHSAMHSKGLPNHMDDSPAPAGPKFQTRPRPARRKPTTCSYCGETFPTQSECMKHHHAKHWRKPFCPNEQRHICEICGASLAAASVIPHMNTHTRARQFACSTCGIKFSSKSSMTRHLLIHTGEKPYACPSCDKRFTQSSSVKLHYRTVHLKEPYPKRNRKKKKDDTILTDDFPAEIESESSR